MTGIDVRSGGLWLRCGAGTDIGRRYPANFDVLHVEAPAGSAAALCVVVADGMGSGAGSAIAGRTAVDTFAGAIRGRARSIDPTALRYSVGRAQREVRAAGQRLAGLTGCTLTALVIEGGTGWIVQVGDSRAYRLRDGLLELLTVDHSMAWLGAIYGWYTADSHEAATARYYLTRYIGHPDIPEPDVLNVALRPGDVFCICTDGVAEPVPYAQLAERLGSGEAPGDIAKRLLADAVAAGGHDNATVAVVTVGAIEEQGTPVVT
jgi:serine/threonine protein phosphatase PrpC